jgi:hypothetical protein
MFLMYGLQDLQIQNRAEVINKFPRNLASFCFSGEGKGRGGASSVAETI